MFAVDELSGRFLALTDDKRRGKTPHFSYYIGNVFPYVVKWQFFLCTSKFWAVFFRLSKPNRQMLCFTASTESFNLIYTLRSMCFRVLFANFLGICLYKLRCFEFFRSISVNRSFEGNVEILNETEWNIFTMSFFLKIKL